MKLEVLAAASSMQVCTLGHRRVASLKASLHEKSVKTPSTHELFLTPKKKKRKERGKENK